jgi:hypothetical protein
MSRLEYSPNPPPQTITEPSAKDLALYLQNELTQISSFIGELSTSKGVATAWVNFDGTTATPTIRSSYNVRSVAKTSTGVYVITFNTPMITADYIINGMSEWNVFYGSDANGANALPSFTYVVRDFSTTPADNAHNMITIYGGV